MIELLGIVATIFVILAFIQRGELRIRIFDTVGAILFILYGSLIHSISVVLLNAILVIIQFYRIAKLLKGRKNG